MYHLAFMLAEWVLWLFGVVDTTRSRLAKDYPAMHGAQR